MQLGIYALPPEPKPRMPLPETPFDADSIFQLSECTYPEWPDAEMLHVLPDEILERHGSIEWSTHDGPYASIPREHLDALVADLEASGFLCHRNDELVTAAKSF